MSLKAGFASTSITPPLAYEIPGGFFKNLATGVHDPLFARAAWLDDGEQAIAVCSADCVFLEAPCVERARLRVAEWTGRDDVAVLMVATHTHSGGPTGDVLSSEAKPEYVEWVADQAATAVVLASRAAETATLKWGIGEAPGVAFNRRFRMRDGSTKTNPGYENADIVECLGPDDPRVGVVAAYDDAGSMLGSLVDFTCHSTFMGGSEYSGDYATWIERAMRAPTVFLPGAIGDVNQCDFVNGRREEASGEAAARRGGQRIADAALEALAGAPACEAPTLRAVSHMVPLPVRGPSAEQVAHAKSVWDAEGDMSIEKVYAREHILLADMVADTDAMDCELQALRIGEMRIGAASVQPFCELGLQVKEGMMPAMFAGLANGHLGYVGPRHAYDESGYELELKRTSKLAPGSGETIVEKLRELIARV